MKQIKYTKMIVSSVLALLMTLTLAVFVYAADGTKADPYVGGNDYGQAYGGGIVLTKYDINKFEKSKAAALITGGAAAGTTVKYHPGEPTGLQLLNPSDVIGTYTRSDENPSHDPGGTAHPVTKAELGQAMANVPFKLEQVKLDLTAGSGTPNPTDPTHYIPVTGSFLSQADGDFATTDTNGVINWSGLAQGYYRVTEIDNDTGSPVSRNPFIVAVPTATVIGATPEKIVYVYPKNIAADGPVIEKSDPVLVGGNQQKWTLKSELPGSMKGAVGRQAYSITDTMSNGLTYANQLQVKFKPAGGGADVALTAVTDYTVNLAAVASTSPQQYKLTITLTAAGFAKVAGGSAATNLVKDTVLNEGTSAEPKFYLHVTYNTEINLTQEELEALAAANKNPNNEVELNFTNSDGTSYKDTEEPKPVLNYAPLKIEKYDGASKERLNGASFKVYTALGTDGKVDPDTVLKTLDPATGNMVDLVLTTADVTSGAPAVTESGVAFYASLERNKTYYLVETGAPSGYTVLSGHFSFTTKSDGTVETVQIDNFLKNGLILPQTGGMGTIIFMIVGICLVIGSGVLLFINHKRKKRTTQNQ